MLDFFRKYQRYFFLVITVVIIISFSFFGTSNTLGSNTWREQVAFKAVNGHEVTRADVDEMALFLATDNDDKILYGGAWGPNFLNDGVIRKDFLETGLGEELALAYRDDLTTDFEKRLAKEKKYVLYTHPQAPFISEANVWNYFAPEMNVHFNALRSASDGLDPDAFTSRVKLYLGEKKIPAPSMRYILNYQEKQYDWLQPDEKLNQTDLSLFGYHTIEDWFGPQFTRLISEFIINAAILAQAQGYEVPKSEVLADLIQNTQISYQQNINNPNLGVTSPEEYLAEQLRRLNIDQSRAVKLWGQVLLFRRMFHDASSTALVDGKVNRNLSDFANENVNVDFYHLPPALKISSFNDLQKLQTYLQAVAQRDKTNPLALPQDYLTVAEVAKDYPELIKKQYELEIAQIDQKGLQAKIGLRQLWNWEVEPSHWSELAKEFPSLAVKEANTREERHEALDSLDKTTRSSIDAFAKQAIVREHPEWVDQALSAAKSEKIVAGLRMKGGAMPFKGLDKVDQRTAFIDLLDQAPLGSLPESGSPLYDFTADGQNYYRITVLNRDSEPEILTFAEAREDQTLDGIRDRLVETFYLSSRNGHPSLYQDENKEWLPFEVVKEKAAAQFFEKELAALEKLQKNLSNGSDQTTASKDQAASLRLYPHVAMIREELEKDAPDVHQFIAEVGSGENKDESEEGSRLFDQWKLLKSTDTFSRQNSDRRVNLDEALALSPESWSAIQTPRNGDLSFYQSKGRGNLESEMAVVLEQTKEAQFLLGAEAQRHLMKQVIGELKSRNAMSLAYLKMSSDDDMDSNQETMEDQ